MHKHNCLASGDELTMFDNLSKMTIPSKEDCLKGREEALVVGDTHLYFQRPVISFGAKEVDQLIFGAGCFWGIERKFWETEGVICTSVGYGGGYTPNPSYEEVCSGKTGHNELVLVSYDTSRVTSRSLIENFFEMHDPTQGMRQGNDIGTQYRSGIYLLSDEQVAVADSVKQEYSQMLMSSGYSPITTEIRVLKDFYFAEDYHQQYLIKVPNGYCGVGGTGICFP